LNGSLGVSDVPVVNQTAYTVEVQYLPKGTLVIAGEVKEIVKVSTGESSTLNDGGVLDIGNTRRPPYVKRRYSRPSKPRHLLNDSRVTFPGNGWNNPDDWSFNPRKREKR
jgi:hypothetical protein